MLRSIVQSFDNNITGVEKLVNFDRDVLEMVTDQIESLHQRLVDTKGIHHPQLNGANTLKMLKSIRDHDSLKPRFRIISNQAIVLLVSYFASCVGDIFRHGVSSKIQGEDRGNLIDEEIKISFREMRDRDWNLKEAVPDLLIAKRDLTFQDMGATHRAFDNYLGVSLDRDRTVNNIILAQACRHVIVHAGATVSERMLKQLSGCHPRDLKTEVHLNETIQFSSDEVFAVGQNMRNYVKNLATKVASATRHD